MASSSKKAGGSINIATFVKFDSTTPADNQVIQATANTDNIMGVSEAGPHVNPFTFGSTTLGDGLAAISGEDVNVYGMGEVCLLRIGGTVTVGDYLTATTGGKGITATTGNHYGAQAEESGVTDQLIRVRVLQGTL